MSNLLEYKCPCCGGAIAFDAEAQKLKCPYCNNTFEVASLKSYDEMLSLEENASEKIEWNTSGGSEWSPQDSEAMNVYSCDSCGAQIVTDKNTAASTCPFCLTPIAMKGQLSGSLKPDAVIPFKVTKQEAMQALQNHYKGKKLLPKVFSKQNHIDEIKGIYVPFWLFDADAEANIRYNATKVHAYSDSNYNYIETSYYALRRCGSVSFANVPVDADTKIADELMEAIEPFDFNTRADFSTAYLAGYMADRYDVEKEDSIERADIRAKRSVEAALAATTKGYSSVTPTSSFVNINDGKVSYALLPVWLLNTSWNGKKYSFAMNGQTGKFIGDLPIDKGIYARKFALWTLGIAAAIYGAMWMIVLM